MSGRAMYFAVVGVIVAVSATGFALDLSVPIAGLMIVTLLIGIAVLGPAAVATTSTGIEYVALVTGTSVAVTVLVGVVLAQAGVGLGTRTWSLAFGFIACTSAVIWYLYERGNRPVPIRSVHVSGRSGYFAACVTVCLGLVCLSLLTAAPSREPTVISLSLVRSESPFMMTYEPGQPIAIEAHFDLAQQLGAGTRLVVEANGGARREYRVDETNGPQVVEIQLEPPPRGTNRFLVFAYLVDEGGALTPTVRLALDEISSRPAGHGQSHVGRTPASGPQGGPL
jgi:hypothetical protein